MNLSVTRKSLFFSTRLLDYFTLDNSMHTLLC
uniref:Uncharacterized protein n=1 Tax=Arundo donax TaxID=35708 RepID=A0A0A8XUR3_ARUDO